MVLQSHKHVCGTLVIRCNSSNAQVQHNKSGEEQPLQDDAWELAYHGAAASTEVPMPGCFRSSPGTSQANRIQIVHILRRTACRKPFQRLACCDAQRLTRNTQLPPDAFRTVCASSPLHKSYCAGDRSAAGALLRLSCHGDAAAVAILRRRTAAAALAGGRLCYTADGAGAAATRAPRGPRSQLP